MAKYKTCTEDFIEWVGGPDTTEADVEDLEKKTRKAFWKWFLISLIPVIGQFTIGLAVFCYNNLGYIESRGRNNGNDLFRGIMILWGLILIPIIEVQILAKADKLGNSVLGWNK